ncbi:MAG: extracellular solute-binding protein [Caldilineaceae bacterium]
MVGLGRCQPCVWSCGGTVQPVNTDLIPSFKNVDERLQNAPWYTVDGVHYGVPYQWGANVLMYNTETFPEAPTSWEVVFKPMDFPDGKPSKGRVQAYDGPSTWLTLRST